MEENSISRELLVAFNRFKRLDMSHAFKILTKGEFSALQAIHRCGAQGIYVWELAEALEVSPPAVSRMLRSMDQNGWIVRQVEATDRRNIRVFATELGVARMHESRKVLDDIANRIVETMGEEDMRLVIALLGRLADTFEAQLQKKSEE